MIRRNEKLALHAALRREVGTPFLIACLLAIFAPGTAANNLCGTIILADLTLDHDLTCTGTALTVGADGITIDLNGHTIAGSGTGFGISVAGRTDVSIVGGIIRNFEAGVRTTNSGGIVIKDNALVENTDGVDLAADSHGNTVKENEFRDNRARGIMVRGASSDHVIKENTFSRNRVGILLFGATETLVKENVVSASTLAGIRINVLAAGNLVAENFVDSNPAGIEVLITATGSATGNTVAENTLAANACGLKGPLDGNTFSENTFDGNAADACS